jgi:hypothetical protein
LVVIVSLFYFWVGLAVSSIIGAAFIVVVLDEVLFHTHDFRTAHMSPP